MKLQHIEDLFLGLFTLYMDRQVKRRNVCLKVIEPDKRLISTGFTAPSVSVTICMIQVTVPDCSQEKRLKTGGIFEELILISGENFCVCAVYGRDRSSVLYNVVGFQISCVPYR